MGKAHQFLILTAILSSSAVRAGSCAEVQQPTCLPGTAESGDWPVATVYMHGLFEFSGSTEFCNLEKENREKLKKIAKDLKIRIAVPVADKRGKYHNWGTSATATKERLADIEKKAEAACGDELMDGGALVGFSNGCYRATSVENGCCNPSKPLSGACEIVGGYAKIITLGCDTQTDGTKECDQSGATTLFHETEHKFPSDLLAQKLEFLRAKGGSGQGAALGGGLGNYEADH